jgi:hypothetical protein
MITSGLPTSHPAIVRNPSWRLELHTDLSALHGLRALVLVDEQNLSISAQHLGYRLNYRRLARNLQDSTTSASLHVFIAAPEENHWSVKQLGHFGYVVHVKTIRRIPRAGGQIRRDTNIDNLFAFWLGRFVAAAAYEAVVLATGDFGLSGELAPVIHRLVPSATLPVMTLSLPGSTAQDLDARRNRHIAANLEVGLDLLKPLLERPQAAQVPFSAFRASA